LLEELRATRDHLKSLENEVRSGRCEVTPESAVAIRRTVARVVVILGAIADAARVQLREQGMVGGDLEYHRLHEELDRAGHRHEGSPRHQ
jgi:hypothetical protein